MRTPLLAEALTHDPNGWECYITLLAQGQGTQLWLTRYENDKPLFTITTSGEDLLHSCRQLLTFLDTADTDIRDSKLLLPHMGDYEIEYHD